METWLVSSVVSDFQESWMEQVQQIWSGGASVGSIVKGIVEAPVFF